LHYLQLQVLLEERQGRFYVREHLKELGRNAENTSWKSCVRNFRTRNSARSMASLSARTRTSLRCLIHRTTQPAPIRFWKTSSSVFENRMKTITSASHSLLM
jgi:hypothetical protein